LQSKKGHKAAKQRISIAFCSNASGSHVLSPLVINQSLKPRALKNVDLNELGIHWRANKTAWMTKELCRDWFDRSFVPEVENI
jgi:hypothetical protein